MQNVHSRLFCGLDLVDPRNAGLRALVLHLARNPVPGSEFDLKNRDIRGLPDDPLLAELRRRWYDALLLISQDRVVAVAVYELQWDGPHMFLEYVPEDLRRRGLSHRLFQAFGELFHPVPCAPGFWWGNGKDPAPGRSLRAFKDGRIVFPFPVKADGHYVRYVSK